MAHDNLNRQLDNLFQKYRDACPDVEGSANFMPALWQKIEARRTLPNVVWRFARYFVSAAAALCILMSLVQFVPSQSPVVMSYLDALDQEHTLLAVYDSPDDDDTPVEVWQ